WRGHLDKLLPARSKVAKVKHHAALPYDALPAFMVELRAQAGVAARALEFLILTVARAGEVAGLEGGEIDLASKVWTVPAERMKAGKEHRVPLPVPALAVLGNGCKDGLIFPNTRKCGKPLPRKAMRTLLERMIHSNVTVHGFRSTFRD